MSHVLVAHLDPGLRAALASLLRVHGHTTTQVADGVLALAALWVAHLPLVALLDAQMTPLGAQDILAVATDGADGAARLRRHRYVVLSTVPTGELHPAFHDALRALNAPVVQVPTDVAQVTTAVADAARYLPSSPRLDTAVPVRLPAAVAVPWPECLEDSPILPTLPMPFADACGTN
jgi:CheY-like chemotaxis protein